MDKDLVHKIKYIVSNSRKNVISKINSALIETYWLVGKEIVENEKVKGINAKTSNQIILELSKQLTNELGRGFSRSNLFNMRKLYVEYPSVQTLSGQINWSQLCELLSIEDKAKRKFYEIETVNSNWSFRELKRQINSSLYERLLLSAGKSNKEKVLQLSREGQNISTSLDLIKDPFVFEFLGLPEKKPILEADLERKLIKHIEEFLLELGKGFMFVGSQQRVTLNNVHHYVDMVFYNKIIKSYVLIELKTRKLQITDAGQLNTYLNYYKTEINDLEDNEPIGIILCTEKDEITAEYILGGHQNNIYASKFTYVFPDKKKLENELERVLKEC